MWNGRTGYSMGRRTPDSCFIRTEYPKVRRTPCSYDIRIPDPKGRRTGYPKGGRIGLYGSPRYSMMILTCLALRLRLFLKGIDSSSRADISLGQPSIHLRNERTASTSLISGKYSFAKSLRFTFNILIFQYFNNSIIFLPHPSSPDRIFSKITPVPSLPLKRGSTAFP